MTKGSNNLKLEGCLRDPILHNSLLSLVSSGPDLAQNWQDERRGGYGIKAGIFGHCFWLYNFISSISL